MRWKNTRRSKNVEDRRRGGPVRRGGSGLFGGGIVTVIIVLVALYFGVDPRIIGAFLDGGSGPVTSTNTPAEKIPEDDYQAQFIAAVLGDTETTWHQIFTKGGSKYNEPHLVLFNGAVNSACGFAKAAIGPFYCPADQKVYIDLGFFHDLATRHKAPGDFAQAYVIAHEVGHHVQNLLNVTTDVRQKQQRMSKAEANALSVKLELQADCLAGVWAHHAKQKRDLLEVGDLEEGLKAAAAVGDDRLQKQARGYVVPESFTHGTSAQRMQWFKTGFAGGDLTDCDTF